MIANMDANQERLEANRKDSPEELEEIMNANQTKAYTNLKELKEDIKTNQAQMAINIKETREEIHLIQTELEETIQNRMEYVMMCVNRETQDLHKELIEKIEETQVEFYR